MTDRQAANIYYAGPTGTLLGPYHPDEQSAQLRARRTLRTENGKSIWRIEANSYEQAQRAAETARRRG